MPETTRSGDTVTNEREQERRNLEALALEEPMADGQAIRVEDLEENLCMVVHRCKEVMLVRNADLRQAERVRHHAQVFRDMIPRSPTPEQLSTIHFLAEILGQQVQAGER